jgi:hypothetical protein
MNNRKLFLLPLLFLSGALWAHTPEEGKIFATLGPFLYQTNVFPPFSTSESPWLSGVGLVAEGDINSSGGIEIAMFYLHKQFFREKDDMKQIEMSKRMYITMGYRWWIGHKFSISPAFASAYSIGDYKIVRSDFPNREQTDTTARERSDYAIDLSVQWEFWSHDRFAAVLDARYSVAITAKPNEYANHYGGLIGIKYMIQEKDDGKDRDDDEDEDENKDAKGK